MVVNNDTKSTRAVEYISFIYECLLANVIFTAPRFKEFKKMYQETWKKSESSKPTFFIQNELVNGSEILEKEIIENMNKLRLQADDSPIVNNILSDMIKQKEKKQGKKSRKGRKRKGKGKETEEEGKEEGKGKR